MLRAVMATMDNTQIITDADLIRHIGSAKFAKLLGVRGAVASQWLHRGRIPAQVQLDNLALLRRLRKKVERELQAARPADTPQPE